MKTNLNFKGSASKGEARGEAELNMSVEYTVEELVAVMNCQGGVLLKALDKVGEIGKLVAESEKNNRRQQEEMKLSNPAIKVKKCKCGRKAKNAKTIDEVLKEE